MSRYCGENKKNIEPIFKAAQHWKTKALLSNRGIFKNEKEIWKIENLEALHSIIEKIDRNKDVFLDELKALLSESEKPEISQLAAEMFWFMLLCTTDRLRTKKRELIKEVWESSSKQFPKNSEWLKDEILGGIGRGGVGFFSRLWWELRFFVLLVIAFKRLPSRQHNVLFSDCWKFAEWLEQNIPKREKRQFRHMILFLLFPDDFERIFSESNRIDIVCAFTGKEREEAEKLSGWEIDRLLSDIRNREQEERRTHELDFYNTPLKEKWRNGNSEEEEEEASTMEETKNPINRILYGPPGTGKTYELNELTKKYSSGAQTLPREAWLRQELEKAEATWFDVIFMALYDLGGEAEVDPSILNHEYIQAKAATRRNQHIVGTIWTELGAHTRLESKTVNIVDKYRRLPWVFDKKKNPKSVWYLVDDWEEECQQQIELAKNWSDGPGQGIPNKRFEFVTFHQAYSYEDFIEGIRPVQSEETGDVRYEVVPGVFKRICQKAEADIKQRYAIFIDEINRGNIASIFGELITLVEADKRVTYEDDGTVKSGMTLTLPYSGEQFGVPENLDVYGAMNTADRSIQLLDTALRRRFEFKELMPDTKVIKGSQGDGIIDDGEGDTINLCTLLEAINLRIRFLLNRDMTIGHSYLINVQNFKDLKGVFLSQIIPLLQEYFYEDWHRIQLVFRDVGPSGEKIEPQIICHTPLKEQEILGFDHEDFKDSFEYQVADPITPKAIRKIYEKREEKEKDE